jgi:Na+-transporting methylmalonyl-CoA/oxaloacetate decarboxylase gamma subunit
MEMHPLAVASMAFAIVMVGMAFLVVVLELFRRVGRRSASRAAAGGGTAAPAASELDDELVAVLAAAAREALGAPVRLYRVHVHRGGEIERWSRAGRMDIMVSHRVEPKR